MKNKVVKVLVAAVLVSPSFALAQTEPSATFDYTTYSDILVAGAIVVASVAGSLGAIKAGVMVWGKISKYFSKAG